MARGCRRRQRSAARASLKMGEEIEGDLKLGLRGWGVLREWDFVKKEKKECRGRNRGLGMCVCIKFNCFVNSFFHFNHIFTDESRRKIPSNVAPPH